MYRTAHGCAVYNEEIYVAGGWSFSGPYRYIHLSS